MREWRGGDACGGGRSGRSGDLLQRSALSRGVGLRPMWASPPPLRLRSPLLPSPLARPPSPSPDVSPPPTLGPASPLAAGLSSPGRVFVPSARRVAFSSAVAVVVDFTRLTSRARPSRAPLPSLSALCVRRLRCAGFNSDGRLSLHTKSPWASFRTGLPLLISAVVPPAASAAPAAGIRRSAALYFCPVLAPHLHPQPPLPHSAVVARSGWRAVTFVRKRASKSGERVRTVRCRRAGETLRCSPDWQ